MLTYIIWCICPYILNFYKDEYYEQKVSIFGICISIFFSIFTIPIDLMAFLFEIIILIIFLFFKNKW